ncbi:hypothetical protein GOBAR_DD36042 [Gossypium barbadense]|nr:hypothetical protein GOBAR_DD36042 [Gossypium barbadense]
MDVSYDSSAYHQSVRGDDMEGMLCEAFNIQSHGLQSFPPDFLPSDDCNLGGNAGAQPGRSVHHEEPNGEAANEYKQILRSRSRSRRTQHRDINKLFTESFHEWLSQTVWSGKNVTDEVKWLSQGPNRIKCLEEKCDRTALFKVLQTRRKQTALNNRLLLDL